MGRTPGRRVRRAHSLAVAVVAAYTLSALFPGSSADAAPRHKPPDYETEPPAAAPDAPPTRVVHTSMAEDSDGLSYSDEFERAELIERMLGECRGIAYNAYELAQTSGESLWLPAPIQLTVLKVHHPFCATLLRDYAPKTSV